MPSILIPLAEGFEELEAVTVIDLLRRAGFEVVSAGLKPGPVRASRKTVIVPDATLDEAIARDWDMVVLPGGLPGATNLNADPRVHDILRRTAQAGRHVAAICAAPQVLANAGLLDNRMATAYPGTLDAHKDRIKLASQAVVKDGKVITSMGPGTAMDFALELIEVLAGKEKRDAVEKPLMRR